MTGRCDNVMRKVLDEFSIIKKYFTTADSRTDVRIGIGDDCAVLQPPSDDRLLVSTVDTLISGVHFPVDTSPDDIAYKTIAVSVSDLAAMGAEPAWLTLAISFPEYNELWLSAFSESFKQTASMFGMQLIGGDTTKGTLSITVQATGFIKPASIMRRDSAKPGDSIYVTGTLGDAALGLSLISSNQSVDVSILEHCLYRLNRPTPRIELGNAIADYCNCAIDISDGLAADLGHILNASNCGACIIVDNVPVSSELRSYYETTPGLSGTIDWETVITAGDDYELCVVVSRQHEERILAIAKSLKVPMTNIGVINNSGKLEIKYFSGDSLEINHSGYSHF